MSRVLAALSTAAVVAFAAAPASAGCANCYAPPPCVTCYQQQVIPPQYKIGWQSLTAGTDVLCTTDITVQQLAP